MIAGFGFVGAWLFLFEDLASFKKFCFATLVAVGAIVLAEIVLYIWRYVWVVPKQMHFESLDTISKMEAQLDQAMIKNKQLEKSLAEARPLQERTIAAQEAQIEEMRRQRESQERERDPAIRAYRDSMHKNASAGEGLEDKNLGIIIWWIANRSAWGRWYTTQCGYENKPQLRLDGAATYFMSHLESGKIIVRARRRDTTNYEEIHPDFWKFSYLRVSDKNPVGVNEVTIAPRTGLKPTTKITDYVYPLCDWNQIEATFPEKDDKIDLATKKLLEESNKKIEPDSF